MKKLLCFLLALLILFPAAAAADYSPALGMTIRKFIEEYNKQPAPLSSPYKILSEPYAWTAPNNQSSAAFFQAENNDKAVIMLLSNDPDHRESLDAGLDSVRINVTVPDAWLSLIALTKRCMSVFYPDDYGIIIPRTILSLIDYHHDNSTNPMFSSKITFGNLNEYILSYIGNSFWIKKAEQ